MTGDTGTPGTPPPPLGPPSPESAPLTPWSPFVPDAEMGERLTSILIARIAELPEEDRATIARAAHAGTYIRRDPDGWLDVVIHADDEVVELGRLHVSSLDTTPRSAN